MPETPAAPPGETVLTVSGLRKSFGRFMALSGVDLKVRAGEVRAIIGPNGAGKTTLINVLGGQLAGDAGRVVFAGKNLMNKYPHQVSAMGVGRTFQISSTFRRMTVYENMLSAHNAASGRWFSLSTALLRKMHGAVMEDLESIHLAELAGRVVDDISHGDRKRLEFGMVLASRPRLLLLDEPTAGMGLQERHDLIDLMLREIRERKITLLFVEHDIDIVFRAADYITVMANGKVFAEGLPGEISDNQEVQEIYLGVK
ncbi:MAG: ABC transporter ATP-binding protein [SAR324 cluster bacterium]|nr:ABC transporter ATP-binding protein [SAR324 cluster bacterium]